MISLKDLKNMEKDDLLRVLGIEERRSGGDVLLSGLGWFAAGVLVGAGAALLWTPRSGPENRPETQEHLGGDGRSSESGRDENRPTYGV